MAKINRRRSVNINDGKQPRNAVRYGPQELRSFPVRYLKGRNNEGNKTVAKSVLFNRNFIPSFYVLISAGVSTVRINLKV